MSESDYPILGGEIARAMKRFQHPLVAGKPATITHSAQTTIPSYQPQGQRPKALRRSKLKWGPIYTNLPVDVIVTLHHPRSRDSHGQETF